QLSLSAKAEPAVLMQSDFSTITVFLHTMEAVGGHSDNPMLILFFIIFAYDTESQYLNSY
ncbi:MAG TPA: hypothetical protein VKX35_09940, partial [Fermentimonas sp.]|nr:hypothetical protein [Fermentimonas sp.]